MLAAACAIILGGVLAACLWPFHAPQNEVAWSEAGAVISGHGTILSQGPVAPKDSPATNGWTLELYLRPEHSWDSRTILALYNPNRDYGFSLRQYRSGLLVENGIWGEDFRPRTPKIYVDHPFRERPPVVIAIASGAQGTSIFINGKLARQDAQFLVPEAELHARIVLANSPVVNDTWRGEIRGLALYGEMLGALVIRSDYQDWIHSGRPNPADHAGALAVYEFSRHKGRIIPNLAGSGPDLYAPPRYQVLHQALLQRPWNEYYPGRGYWKNVLYNIGGFVPLGFCLYSCFFLVLRARRSLGYSIVLGAAVSLGVEVLQSFLPTRDSGMTDILTNTLGSAIGAVICQRIIRQSQQLIAGGFLPVRLVGLLFYDESNLEKPDLIASHSGLV